MTMPINTLIWGYPCEQTKIIDNLADNGVIVKKCWISRLWHRQDKLLKKRAILKESTFYSSLWLKKYHDEITYYRDCVEFNPEVYSKVYEKLYLFIDQFSRHDHRLHEKSIHEYINQFNLLYHFFYSIFVKEQIQLVLFDCIPHLGVELIIYEIAKALNVKTVLVFQSMVSNKYFYFEKVEDYGDFHFMTPQEDNEHVKLEKKFFIDHFYMQNVKEFRFSLLQAFVRSFKRPYRLFEEFLYNYQRYLRVRRYKRNLLKSVDKTVDYGKKYVYFPLHLQPELTTSALGGVFNDQALALEILSQKIPKDWKIYVKENPKQADFMRDDIFFERLKCIDNLQIVPLRENTFKLIEHSQFVATITGTAGWEAICGGRPALVFGRTWYQNFEGVFKWHFDIDIENVASYQINHAKLENDYNALMSKCAIGVVDRMYSTIAENYDEKTNIQSITNFLAKLINEIFGHCCIKADENNYKP